MYKINIKTKQGEVKWYTLPYYEISKLINNKTIRVKEIIDVYTKNRLTTTFFKR